MTDHTPECAISLYASPKCTCSASTDHTPEPCNICGTTPEFVERKFPKLSAYVCPRCTACVNACAGIPTEQLRRGGVADLVLVLQGILDEPDNDMTLDSLEAARAALASFRKN